MLSYPESSPLILSCSGPVLLASERALFSDIKPFGFIVFGRNIETQEQLSSLCRALRDSVGWSCPILVDQEGGRVQRLRPPEWSAYPSMRSFGACCNKGGLEAALRDLSRDLLAVGLNVNCAPVLDVLCAETHPAIGDRAFSEDPVLVGELGALACRVFLEEGVIPVVKHIPGQGRANLDSHRDLPVVTESIQELQRDFDPFRFVFLQPDLRKKIWGMVSHVVYSVIDRDHPASVSPALIRFVRETLGFQGILVSDDLGMEALARYGDIPDRVNRTLEAGVDLALYCAGEMGDMEAIAKGCPALFTKEFGGIDVNGL